MLVPLRSSLALGLILALTGCTRPTPTEPLLLGYLGTTQEAGRRGVQLAVKEVNETDGLLGGRAVRMLAPGTPDEPEPAQAIAARLVAVNRVTALIGGADAAQAEAFGRAAQPAGVPVVAPCVLASTQVADNVFPAQLAPADQGYVLARFAVEELKADRVAVLAGSDAPHAELATAFIRQFTKDDSSGKAERHSFDATADLAALVEEVKKTAPKAILTVSTAADFAALRETLRQGKVETPLLFGGGAADRLELETRRDVGQGVYVATLVEPDANSKFEANHEKEFGQKPDAAARLAYDAARVLFSALRRARLTNRERTREELTRLREELARVIVVKLDDGKPGDMRSYKLPGK